MKGLICYDTKYGSTELIAQGIKKGMGSDVEVKNIRDVKRLDYDIIVVGSPIFNGKPLHTFSEFIQLNYEKLQERNLALFVTCWASATRYNSSAGVFIETIKKYLPNKNLLYSEALPGRLMPDKISERDKKVLFKIIKRVRNITDELGDADIDWKDASDFDKCEQYGRNVMLRLPNINSSIYSSI